MFESISRMLSRKEQYRSALRSVETDPLTARHWHDATDPHQAARIEAAAAKRARKAEKLYRDARYSGGQNYNAYAANILHVTK